MARNDKAKQFRSNRSMQKLASGISDNMDSLYRKTYMAAPQASNALMTVVLTVIMLAALSKAA